MPKVLKLMSTIHLIWCTVVLGTSTCCQLRDFLPSRRKGLLQHIGVNEVSVKRDSTVFCLTATHLFFFSFSMTRLRKTCSSHTLDPTVKLFSPLTILQPDPTYRSIWEWMSQLIQSLMMKCLDVLTNSLIRQVITNICRAVRRIYTLISELKELKGWWKVWIENKNNYHLLQISLPFHWPRPHHVTCK